MPNLVLAAIFAFALTFHAQQAGAPPQTVPSAQNTAQQPAAPAKRQAPRPAADAAPGGGPDKVWVNLNSSKYHCPGDRYYGKTANGRYMTEAAAKAAGAKGPAGKTCFTTK